MTSPRRHALLSIAGLTLLTAAAVEGPTPADGVRLPGARAAVDAAAFASLQEALDALSA